MKKKNFWKKKFLTVFSQFKIQLSKSIKNRIINSYKLKKTHKNNCKLI